jgi:hypothetical protein
MRGGNFARLPTIYNSCTTCLQNCPNGPVRQPFPTDIIPASMIDPTAAVLMKVWGASNLPGNVNNLASDTSLGGNQEQVKTRADYALGDKQRILARYTYWNGTACPLIHSTPTSVV